MFISLFLSPSLHLSLSLSEYTGQDNSLANFTRTMSTTINYRLWPYNEYKGSDIVTVEKCARLCLEVNMLCVLMSFFSTSLGRKGYSCTRLEISSQWTYVQLFVPSVDVVALRKQFGTIINPFHLKLSLQFLYMYMYIF